MHTVILYLIMTAACLDSSDAHATGSLYDLKCEFAWYECCVCK